MSYTFDLELAEGSDGLQVSRVRNYIDDICHTETKTEGKDYFFSDARILQFLTGVENEANTAINRAKLAAADCLETMADNLDFVVGDKQSLGESTSRSRNAQGLRDRAERLRSQVANSNDSTTADDSPGVVTRTRADGYASAASGSEYSSSCVYRRCC